MRPLWVISFVLFTCYLSRHAFGAWKTREHAAITFSLPLDASVLKEHLQSQEVDDSPGYLLSLESACFTALLEAKRFQRRYGAKEWSLVKPELLRLYSEAQRRLLRGGNGYLKGESQRVNLSICRYIEEIGPLNTVTSSELRNMAIANSN